MSPECRVEDLVGRPLCDADGKKIGRIQELVVEIEGTDWLVVEFHVGPGALLERLAEISSLVPVLGALQRRIAKRYRIAWHEVDLSDPDHPRTFVRRVDLKYLD